MKMVCVLICALILITDADAQSLFFDKNPEGWHWNDSENTQAPKKLNTMNSENKTGKSKNIARPIAQMNAIHKALKIAKDRAVLNPTVSNIRDYLMIQQLITEQSTQFAKNWQKTLLLYPEFDYNLKHPVDSSENQAYQSHLHDLKVQTAHQLSSHYGLFYFYRGNNTLDQVMAKTVVQFTSWYHFSLIGVSVDHKILPDIDNNRINQGQLEKLGVKALPALILIDPKTGKHSVLAYGYASSDELLTSCFNLATNFRELN